MADFSPWRLTADGWRLVNSLPRLTIITIISYAFPRTFTQKSLQNYNFFLNWPNNPAKKCKISSFSLYFLSLAPFHSAKMGERKIFLSYYLVVFVFFVSFPQLYAGLLRSVEVSMSRYDVCFLQRIVSALRRLRRLSIGIQQRGAISLPFRFGY